MKKYIFLLCVLLTSNSFAGNRELGYLYYANVINEYLEGRADFLDANYDFPSSAPIAICRGSKDGGLSFTICTLDYLPANYSWRGVLLMKADSTIIYHDNEDFLKGVRDAEDELMKNIVELEKNYKYMAIYRNAMALLPK